MKTLHEFILGYKLQKYLAVSMGDKKKALQRQFHDKHLTNKFLCINKF